MKNVSEITSDPMFSLLSYGEMISLTYSLKISSLCSSLSTTSYSFPKVSYPFIDSENEAFPFASNLDMSFYSHLDGNTFSNSPYA